LPDHLHQAISSREYIELLGVEGQVTTIALFATTLLHSIVSRVVIPNRKIVGSPAQLWHHPPLSLSVGVSYDTNINETFTVIREIYAESARPQDPAPGVGVTSLADSSVNIAIMPWAAVSDYARLWRAQQSDS